MDELEDMSECLHELPEESLIFTVDKGNLSKEENEARRFLVQRLLDVQGRQFIMYRTGNGVVFFVIGKPESAYGDMIANSYGKAFGLTRMAYKPRGKQVQILQTGKHPRVHGRHGNTVESAVYAITKKEDKVTEIDDNLDEKFRTRVPTAVSMECGDDTIAMRLQADMQVNYQAYNEYQRKIGKKIVATGKDFDRSRPSYIKFGE